LTRLADAATLTRPCDGGRKTDEGVTRDFRHGGGPCRAGRRAGGRQHDHHYHQRLLLRPQLSVDAGAFPDRHGAKTVCYTTSRTVYRGDLSTYPCPVYGFRTFARSYTQAINYYVGNAILPGMEGVTVEGTVEQLLLPGAQLVWATGWGNFGEIIELC
jgi:hypothetical protein